MDRYSVWSAVRRMWALVLIPALLGLVVGAYFELSKPSAYTANIRVFANSGAADGVQVSQSTLALQRMGSYVKVADSTEFAQRLVTRLNLPESAAVVAQRISASLEKDTVIMQVSVGGATRDEALRIAQAFPAEYTDFVNGLVEGTVTTRSRVVFTTIDGPHVSRTTSLTKVALSSLFGLFLGAGLGLALAVARSRRRSGRSPEALATMTGAAVVGIIPKLSDAAMRDVWAVEAEESLRLASHRLARNLPYLGVPPHGVIVVTAPTRGAGTTHVAVGLAGALAQRGQRVLIVDAAFSTALSALLGVDVPFPASAVIRGGASLDQAVVQVQQPRRIDFLSYGAKHGMELSPAERDNENAIFDELRSQYDSIIVDAAPVLARAEAPIALEHADAVLLVVDHLGNSAQVIRAAADALVAMTSTPTGLVVNKAALDAIPREQVMSGVVLSGATAGNG
ncbi:AAA family ATPase [Pedococcus sp. KACC 23699]|uniref:AAA family ATPase n=1 Tax=Pedococcus sp. KACC 23699 TaxID=3149228 RepID=A0AAU7JWX9_9MICO